MAPAGLQLLLNQHKNASDFFDNLAFTHKREYVEWILSAKMDDTRQIRLQTTLEKLIAGKKNINEK